MASLIDMLQDQMSAQLTREASTALGEDDSSVGNAFKGLMATILGGMTRKVETPGETADGLFGSLTDPRTDAFLGQLGGLIGQGNIAKDDPRDIAGGLMGQLFGDKTAPILAAVAAFAGLKNAGSASRLLGVAGPLVMGALSKHIKSKGMNAAGLKDALMGERDVTYAAVPDQVAPLLGIDRPAVPAGAAIGGAAAATTAAAARTHADEHEEKRGGMWWLWPLIGVLLLGLLLWRCTGGGGDADRTVREVEERDGAVIRDAGAAGDELGAAGDDLRAQGAAVTDEAVPTPGDAIGAAQNGGDALQAAGRDVSGTADDLAADMAGRAETAGDALREGGRDAADAARGAAATAGTALSGLNAAAREAVEDGQLYAQRVGDMELQGARGGVEESLVGFIESGREPCTEADCWFSFDRLTFRSGSAELDRERSQQQIDNMVAIMTAYPDVQLKLGGYTDNTGNAQANMALSQARADAVKAAVVAEGIEESRLVTEGYGDQFPRADNATAEGRALNRRIDVRVRERG